MKMTSIKLEPGALDDVPIVELARFFAAHGLELVCRPDGLYLRRMPQKEVDGE